VARNRTAYGLVLAFCLLLALPAVADHEGAAPKEDAFPVPLYTGRPAPLLRNSVYIGPGVGFGPCYTLPIKEEDWWRLDMFFDSASRSCACRTEWYLGHGVSAGVQVETGLAGVLLPASLYWYPFEGVELQVGLDLLQSRVVLSSRLIE